MSDLTRRFDLSDMKEWETREILTEVYNSLQQKGYNPINQMCIRDRALGSLYQFLRQNAISSLPKFISLRAVCFFHFPLALSPFLCYKF